MILQNWWFTTLVGRKGTLRPALQNDIGADVLIIGGGATGLSAARKLMESGLHVVLLERNICGGSSTGKSAGFLTPDSELELSQLIRRFGVQGARDLWEVPTQGIQLMKSTIEAHGIECDFMRQDSLFLGKGASGLKDVLEEFEGRKKLGYKQTLYGAAEIPSILGSRSYSGGVRYSDTYGINALQYAQSLKEVLLEKGVEIYEASEVRSISGHTAKTHLGSVTADVIILCADKMKPALSPYARNIFHAQTFLSISEPLKARERDLLFPSGHLQCWDSDLVYSYYRLTGDQRVLLGGGSMLTTFSMNDVTTPRVIERVIRGFKRAVPGLKDVEFIQYWPGRIDCTRDLLPTVGRDKDSPWIHFAFGCVGLPWATFCGDFVARHVLNDRSEDTKYYHYFRADRRFLLPVSAERLVGKQLVFSANNAWSKYFQVSRGSLTEKSEGT
jgi:gamma-glutamylputrescine oxidase